MSVFEERRIQREMNYPPRCLADREYTAPWQMAWVTFEVRGKIHYQFGTQLARPEDCPTEFAWVHRLLTTAAVRRREANKNPDPWGWNWRRKQACKCLIGHARFTRQQIPREDRLP